MFCNNCIWIHNASALSYCGKACKLYGLFLLKNGIGSKVNACMTN